jgi:hypothetical protein
MILVFHGPRFEFQMDRAMFKLEMTFSPTINDEGPQERWIHKEGDFMVVILKKEAVFRRDLYAVIVMLGKDYIDGAISMCRADAGIKACDMYIKHSHLINRS